MILYGFPGVYIYNHIYIYNIIIILYYIYISINPARLPEVETDKSEVIVLVEVVIVLEWINDQWIGPTGKLRPLINGFMMIYHQGLWH
jgi:hypothetical protein